MERGRDVNLIFKIAKHISIAGCTAHFAWGRLPTSPLRMAGEKTIKGHRHVGRLTMAASFC